MFRADRKAQYNLLEVLSATCSETWTREGLRDTCCPRGRDFFFHMLQFYDLTQHIERGAAVVLYLLRTVRETQILYSSARKLYGGGSAGSSRVLNAVAEWGAGDMGKDKLIRTRAGTGAG